MTGGSAVDAAPLTSLASASFFGSFIFATVALVTRAALIGRFQALDIATLRPQQQQQQKSNPLDVSSYNSWCTLFFSFSVLGLILFYAYLCENHPLYPHSEKSYDRDHVFFLTSLLMVISAWSLRPNDSTQQEQPQQSSGKSQQLRLRISSSSSTTASEDNDLLNRHQTEEWKGW